MSKLASVRTLKVRVANLTAILNDKISLMLCKVSKTIYLTKYFFQTNFQLNIFYEIKYINVARNPMENFTKRNVKSQRISDQTKKKAN